jgi:toxin ParE1/3/4
MTPPLFVRSAAEADATDAALWYEARAVGLGADFLRAVDVALTEIQRMPERFPLVHRGCRRALLRRFPYALYFVPSSEAI